MIFVVSAAFDIIDSNGVPVSTAGVWHGVIEAGSTEDARISMQNWLVKKHGQGLRVVAAVVTPRNDLMWLPK